MAEPNVSQQTKAMLAVVWEKNRDLILHRLDTIDAFCRNLPGSASDDASRAEASADAHKLAGSLGMFGLSEGTVIAREIEYCLRDGSTEEVLAGNIPERTNLLRKLIERFRIEADKRQIAERRRRVLIVESNPAAAKEIAECAEKHGMEARIAVDLSGAERALKESSFELLILDLATAELGRTSGADDEDRVRDLILSRAPMQVLALTSEDTFEDRVTAAQVGAHGFLPKTVPVAEIVDTGEHLLNLQSTQFKVLTVDDDPAVLKVIEGLLEQHAIRVTSLADPRLFWNVLEETVPDLVILDLEMPNFSGIELCRAIRNDSQWNRLPVVFLSATGDAPTVTTIFSAGADDFVAKPIIDIELLTRVRNRLERDRLYRDLSDYDQLTGVRNRRSSNVVIANYLRLAVRHGLPVSLLALDLDKFKRVNDTYGHQAGDDVLQHLGSLLRQSFRSEDVVARWGGEEFVIAMFAMRRSDAVERLAEVLEQLEAHEFESSPGTRFRVSFSAGLAEFPEDGKDLHSLYRLADEALYRAKAAGGGRIYVTARASDLPQRTEIAVVSPDLAQAASLRHLLEMRGYTVDLYRDPQHALRDLGGENPAIAVRAVVLDEPSPEILSEMARSRREGLPSLLALYSGDAPESFPNVEIVAKPYKSAHLMQRLRRVIAR